MWVTKTDAAALIGADPQYISDESLAMAASIIETFIDREVEDINSIYSRDLRRIQKAIAWQALFLEDQPDYGYRTMLDEVRQDGQSVIFAKTSDGVDLAAQALHPIAYRTLKNLSWLRGPLTPRARRSSASFSNEESDAYHRWEPIV